MGRKLLQPQDPTYVFATLLDNGNERSQPLGWLYYGAFMDLLPLAMACSLRYLFVERDSIAICSCAVGQEVLCYAIPRVSRGLGQSRS